MPELYIGLMSGTSMDGVDAVLVDLAAAPRVLAAHTHPMPHDLGRTLLDLAEDRDHPGIDLLGRLDVTVGELFATAATQLLATAGVAAAGVRAIGSHGQTVRHRPDADPPFTLQIGDPNVIAERSGITTVADFRRRDLAAGGQGAPLVPAFHAARFHAPGEARAVLNIGGIANLTVLPPDPAAPVTGFDTGPGNALLDAWGQRHTGQSYDAGGAWAATATPDRALLERLLMDPYFHRPPPKSTGREHFHPEWLAAALAERPYPPAVVQATLTALTAHSVAGALAQWAPATEHLLVCGGGVHNRTLMEMLAKELVGCRVESTAVHGLDPDWVEAVAFAWLAQQTLAGRPGNLPAVTGACGPRVLGAIYAGS